MYISKVLSCFGSFARVGIDKQTHFEKQTNNSVIHFQNGMKGLYNMPTEESASHPSQPNVGS